MCVWYGHVALTKNADHSHSDTMPWAQYWEQQYLCSLPIINDTLNVKEILEEIWWNYEQFKHLEYSVHNKWPTIQDRYGNRMKPRAQIMIIVRSSGKHDVPMPSQKVVGARAALRLGEGDGPRLYLYNICLIVCSSVANNCCMFRGQLRSAQKTNMLSHRNHNTYSHVISRTLANLTQTTHTWNDNVTNNITQHAHKHKSSTTHMKMQMHTHMHNCSYCTCRLCSCVCDLCCSWCGDIFVLF